MGIMTWRRSGEAPVQQYSSFATIEELSTPRTHLGRHLHLTHNIHVKNYHTHMHRKDHNRMLDPRRAPPLPLMRELTAVKKVKSLQDPSTSSCSFSPASACSTVAGHDCRLASHGYGGAHLDDRVRRPPRRSKGREETEGYGGSVRRGVRVDEYAALAEWRDHHPSHDQLSSHSYPNANAASYRVEKRWQGDAAEIARRLVAERSSRISSPGHTYMASLARAHGLSLLGLRDDITTSEAEGSFRESEDGDAASLMAPEALSNSAASPLVLRGHRNRRRWKDAGHWNGNGNLQCQDEDEKAGSQVSNPSGSHRCRPRSFKEIVGQASVVKSLTTAITKGRVAQVYLFVGPRGTGKTTCARVFAAALVCLNVEPHRRPCGLCRECATLTLNRSRDVTEVDVTNSPDLDHMRSLLSRTSNAHQRVFIVKRCEERASQLWSSLLDDPPQNVVFILTTTDLERLPMSATSRCQKYQFGKLKESEIVTRLRVLAEKENLDVDEAALSLIASRAEGSLRDAESMLDQLSLLDQTVTLSMVQELSGLIPDEKLVDLLDVALGADTANTVKGMRELLEAGVDALSLVAQLGSLITNILAGAFDVPREARKKGFFHRNMPKREEQQRLRQALMVLAECEKQLRASSDRPTWLTAALLQFAPDRSYLPSSVDTSKAPSPVKFDTPGHQPRTPRQLPPPQPSARKHSQKSFTSSFQAGQKLDEEKVAVGRILASPSGNQMEQIWVRVLDGCRSNVLRQLLSSHGTLVALSVASDETFAVAQVEFRSSEHKARAERLRSSACHAFQMALGCPVELKLSLESSSVALEGLQASHAILHCASSSGGFKAHTANSSGNEVPSEFQLRQPRSSRHEMLTGLAARSRRLADAGSGPRLSSHARNYNHCFPAAGSSRRYRSGRRPSLTRVPSLDAPGVKVRWQHPKFKSITIMERRNRKLKPRRRRITRVALCWQSPLSDLEQPQSQVPEPSRKMGFFHRLVPCGRSIQTHGSPINRP